MTRTYETAMELNGYKLPCMIEYEFHAVDGVIVYSVTLGSKETGPLFDRKGSYLGMGRKFVEVTKLLTTKEIDLLAEEVGTALACESAANEAESLALELEPAYF